MIRYAKIVNEETKEVIVGNGCTTEYYIEIGMTEMDVEQAYTGTWYVTGYAPSEPEPTIDELKLQKRSKRNNYLMLTDYTQLNDAPLTDAEKTLYQEYRQYLRDFTEQENWWTLNVPTFEEWLVAHHPVTE